jgi:small nuclear ribonucleoprotein (snRNP)-like protein
MLYVLNATREEKEIKDMQINKKGKLCLLEGDTIIFIDKIL